MPSHHLVARLQDMTAEELRRRAFRWPGGSLSLGELRERMLRLAHWLKAEAAVRPGDRVAICLPKSPEALVAMYGIMASGAAYVPLQFAGPPERLTRILASVEPRLLVTTGAMAERFDAQDLAPLLKIEPSEDGTGLEDVLARSGRQSAIADVRPDDVSWVIFTSGSTGEPKGVMLSHRNMAANVDWMQRRDRMTERDLRISHAALHYIAVFDLLFPMASTVRIFLLGEREAMFPDHVAEAMERERSTVWSSSATALRLLVEHGELERRDLGAMRRMSFYGEPMPIAVLRRLMAALPGTEFSNHYGATEIDNVANFEVPRPLPDDVTALPLGRPALHCAVTLRNETGAEVSPGEVGEICVVSDAVASGYWKDPALTASKRFGGRPDSFRTGDLAVLRPDGLLHPIGRKDQMVKIRGHRFDLGEVEAAIKAHPKVRDAAVFALAAAAGQTELRAAVLAGPGAGLASELRSICAARLPAFARPVRILELEQFPLLSTGKIDRQALKELVSGARAQQPADRDKPFDAGDDGEDGDKVR
ncbi:MAG TPA: amino acid adenylation domain-containing protein [Candidatus Bathyarchaeia archaeon]|nr:amino acid adenylation domain-containing protein [Candidatus Bathyarchaeia archaeon]